MNYDVLLYMSWIENGFEKKSSSRIFLHNNGFGFQQRLSLRMIELMTFESVEFRVERVSMTQDV